MTTQNNGKLTGKVALITGGSRGLGLGITEIFLRQGAKVAILARDRVRGDAAVEMAREWGPEGACIFVSADLTDEAAVKRAMDHTAEHFGALHILVNNAAPTRLHGENIVNLSLEVWEAYLREGVTSAFLASKYAIPHMQKAGYGSIINVSSNAAERAIRNNSGYSTCKAALHGLTLSTAVDFGPVVRCNELVIGHLHHNDHPLYRFMEEDAETKAALDKNYMVGRWGYPQDLGYACAFLGSEESAFVTADTMHLDGGSQRELRFPSMAGAHKYMREVHAREAEEHSQG